jgi:curved DNA-binding protein CbpA
MGESSKECEEDYYAILGLAPKEQDLDVIRGAWKKLGVQ